MKKIIIPTIILLALATFGYTKYFGVPAPEETEAARRTPTKTPPKVVQSKSPTPTSTPQQVLHTVPFLSQAPFGGWSDPRQQDGCEEASLVMAMEWVKKNTTISAQKGLEDILQLSAFSQINYGTYHDTSALDTFRFFSDFYHYEKVHLKKNIVVNDIIDALKNNSIVIVPTNGRILKNPNYTAPGPEHHMLVIIGYDLQKKEFITNDPGTRKGKGYRYSFTRLYDAIDDYPTGIHLPRTEVSKPMIIVSR